MPGVKMRLLYRRKEGMHTLWVHTRQMYHSHEMRINNIVNFVCICCRMFLLKCCRCFCFYLCFFILSIFWMSDLKRYSGADGVHFFVDSWWPLCMKEYSIALSYNKFIIAWKDFYRFKIPSFFDQTNMFWILYVLNCITTINPILILYYSIIMNLNWKCFFLTTKQIGAEYFWK